MRALPPDWRCVRLGDALRIRYGKALPPLLRSDEAAFPVLGSAGRMTATAEPLVQEAAVIVGRKGNVGSVHVEMSGCWPIDTTYYAAIPDDFDPRFLGHQLGSLELVRLDSSTTTPSLRREDLEAVELVVPPIEEQRRIVDILEDHLSRLDAADALLRTIRTRSGAVARAAADRLIWGGGTDGRAVGSVLSEPMRNGHSARASADGNGVRTLTLTAVTKCRFTDEFTKLTSADPNRVRDLWLRPGDILVQRANTAELVGTAALYTGPVDWSIFPDLLIRLRADRAVVSPEYLAAALRTERAHRWLRSRAKGLAGSMPKIDQGTIAALKIPIPPARGQGDIVQQLEALQSSTDRIVATVDGQESRSQSLRRSLLSAAFAGDLTRGHELGDSGVTGD